MMKRNYYRYIGEVVFLAVLCLAFGLSGKPAMAETAADQDGKQLVIDVVEEIPAEEIEEAAVPLAAMPDSQARSNVRHLVLMGVFLACVLGYILYFRNFKRHLRMLRGTASELSYEMLERKRKEGRV